MFASTGLSVYPHSYRLRLHGDNGLTHGYATLSQTVSGTSGTNTLTASAAIDTAPMRPGSVVHIGPSNHVYTVLTASGTTITVTPNLTQTYIAGTGLKLDVISSWDDDSGFGHSLTQATAANRPGYMPDYFNGQDAVCFTMASKSLLLPSSSVIDNIFAGGGTVMFVIEADSDGEGNAGRIFEKRDSGNTNAAWNIITTAAGGGYFQLLFNQATSGTDGAFTTGSVLQLGTPRIVFLYYDSSTPTTKPIIRVQGLPVPVTTTTAPTGTATSDAGGDGNLGNRSAGGRGIDARIGEFLMWKRQLGTYEMEMHEFLFSEKYGVALESVGVESFGARTFIITEPTAPAGLVPLVLFLHGGSGSAISFINQLTIGPYLEEDAVLAFPTATKNNVNANTWNSGGAETFNHAPDSIYLVDLINYIVDNYPVDPAKIFIVGHSNGAMMGYRLIIENPTLIAGLFAMAGNVMVSNPNTYTGRILHYHGEDDENVPLSGGVGIGGITYPVPQTAVEAFTNADVLFIVLASPAGHAVSLLEPALVLLGTTLQDEITNFVLA